MKPAGSGWWEAARVWKLSTPPNSDTAFLYPQASLFRSEKSFVVLDEFKNSILFIKSAFFSSSWKMSMLPSVKNAAQQLFQSLAVCGLLSYSLLPLSSLNYWLTTYTSLQIQICTYTIFICIIIKRNLVLFEAVYSKSSNFISNHSWSSLYSYS